MEGLAADHAFRATVSALAALTTWFGPQDLGTLPPARAFEVTLKGHHRLEGGLGAIEALFLDKIATASGDIRTGATVTEIAERRGRVTSLRLRPRDQVVGLDALVWAGPASSLLGLLGDTPPRPLREMAGALRPACYRYVLAGLIDAAGIPDDFAPRVLSLADAGRPPLEDNALLLTIDHPDARPDARPDTHPNARPRGVGAQDAARPRGVGAQDAARPFWIECLVPAPAVAAGPGYLTLVRSRCRERLRQIIPDFERHLIALASLHDGLAAEVRRPGEDCTTREPEPLPAYPMTPVLSSDLPRFLDLGAAPAATGLKNVILAGLENLPGLGREGDFVTGLSAARRVTRAHPRRTSRRREILILDA